MGAPDLTGTGRDRHRALAHGTERSADVVRAGLPNGLRVVVAPEGSPVTAVATVLRGGTRDDPPGRAGLAHLCEHLALADGPAGSDCLTTNGSTRADHTVLTDCGPPAELRAALTAVARRLTPVEATHAVLDRELGVLHEEAAARRTARPYGRFPRPHLRSLLFRQRANRSDHAFAVPDHDAALDGHDFRVRHHVPSGAVVSISGPVSVPAALEMAAEVLGALPGGRAPEPDRREPVLPPLPPLREEAPDIPLPALGVGWRVDDPADLAGLAALLVLCEALGDGASPRSVTARAPIWFGGVVAGVDLVGDPLTVRDPTGLTVRGLLAGPDLDRAAEQVVDTMRDLATEPLPDEDLQAARARARFRVLRTLATPTARATLLGLGEQIHGDPAATPSLTRILLAVDRTAVQAAATALVRRPAAVASLVPTSR